MSAEDWLLTLTIDGRTYRWGTTALEVDGDLYVAGLSDPGGVARGEDTIDLSLVDPSVDWPAVVFAADGGDATLYRTRGDAAPVPYVTGEVRVLSYGARDEAVALRIERRAGAESLGVQVPDAYAQITEATWPASGGATIGDSGRFYPVVLGYPGYLGTGTQTYAAMPLPLAQWSTTTADVLGVLSEDASRQITEVLVRADTLATEETRTVGTTGDLRLRQVLTVGWGATSTTVPYSVTDPRDLYAGFYPDGGGGPRNAYEVLVYLLRRWGGATAWDRLPEIADALSVYQVDTWIDSPVTDPWAWIEATILGDLPFEARTGPNGRYLVERRYLSDPDRNVGTIREGETCAIAGSVAFSEGPYNEFVAQYRGGRNGEWLASLVLTGSDGLLSAATTAGTTTTTKRSGRCTASVSQYGPRQATPLAIDWTWDESTVGRVLEVAAARDALPARLVSYTVQDGEDLEEGDEVTLYDEVRGFAGVPAIVDAPPVAGRSDAVVAFRVPT